MGAMGCVAQKRLESAGKNQRPKFAKGVFKFFLNTYPGPGDPEPRKWDSLREDIEMRGASRPNEGGGL
jgi:hypothetical protein